MNSDVLKDLLKTVHKVFPLPVSDSFRGTHNFSLDSDGKVSLRVWYKSNDGTIKAIEISFDNDEEITKMALKLVRGKIQGLYDGC